MATQEFVYGEDLGSAEEVAAPQLGFYELSVPCDLLMAALVEMGKTLKNPSTNRKAKIPTRAGNEYSYSYTDLGATFDCIRAPLSSAGLAILQIPSVRPGVVSLTTILAHASSQRLTMRLDLPVSLQGETRELFQRVGGMLTWLRRYSVTCLFPIASESDHDGPPEQSGPAAQTREGDQRPPAPSVPSPAAPQAAKATAAATPPEWRVEFGRKCEEALAAIGKDTYLRILSSNGYTQPGEVPNRDKAQALVNELREVAQTLRRQRSEEKGSATPSGRIVNAHGIAVDNDDVPFGSGVTQ